MSYGVTTAEVKSGYGLSTRDEFRLRFADSYEDMQEAVSLSPNLVLGMSIPEDFDQQAGAPQPRRRACVRG